MPNDVKDILSRPAVTTDSLKDLSLAALFMRMAQGSDAATKKKLERIVNDLKSLGLADTKLDDTSE